MKSKYNLGVVIPILHRHNPSSVDINVYQIEYESITQSAEKHATTVNKNSNTPQEKSNSPGLILTSQVNNDY